MLNWEGGLHGETQCASALSLHGISLHRQCGSRVLGRLLLLLHLAIPPGDRAGDPDFLDSSIRLAISAGTMAILALHFRKSGMKVKIGDPGLE